MASDKPPSSNPSPPTPTQLSPPPFLPNAAVSLVPPLQSPSQLTMHSPSEIQDLQSIQNLLPVLPPDVPPTTALAAPLSASKPIKMPLNTLPLLPTPPPMPTAFPMPVVPREPRTQLSGASRHIDVSTPARIDASGSCSSSKSVKARTIDDLSEADANTATISKSAKKGTAKVRYSDAMDLVLLAAVNTIGAHIPKYGEKEKKFEEVASACRSHPVFRGCDKLSGKSVRDRFTKLRNEFRKNDTENARTSGIDESVTGKDRLLYDIWEQIEDERNMKEAEATKKNEQSQVLLEAGEEMRNLAMERVRKKRRIENESDTAADCSTPSSKSKHNTIDVNSAEEFQAAFQRADQRHAEIMSMESRKLEFDEHMVSIERSKLDMKLKDQDRQEKMFSLQESRLEFEKKKFEHQRDQDIERSRQDRKDRDAQLKLMEMLVPKLSKE